MSFTPNRFAALLGDEEGEVDKLGNLKPAEKKDKDQPPTRREQRRINQKRVPAVSPPSRREQRGGRSKDVGQQPLEENTNQPNIGAINSEKREKQAIWKEGRNKIYDRHSRTGIYDNEKKVTMGWGEAGTSELQGANDVLDPKDPDAPETGRFNADETTEDHTKTLDQYLEERKSSGHFPTLPEPRKPNEGVADSELKEAVPYRKESDNYFVGKDEAGSKAKGKAKKGKSYLEIDQPSYRPSGGRNASGRHSRGTQRGKRGDQISVNLSDDSAFPILGA
ncbi:hypothetical protein G6F70_000770 [Rhizopus microsporus]|uniref:Hyaluronan/mRNA-binding protein domain-containing protein n=1 Tax=Rhizopus microsporus TaxID=58291 RepID=A0A1X0S389_RHIZD|nr:hypothetical protein G6F71_000529 [Rhizopus microsporus]KAG1204114.1 hypothetical protein G6F70_000770 [Rhizopus microsporus]KAG1215467.1 hypothetical protein G6F69_000985 [Rhizopus microsporus]KAG1238015.1 hypothetical protein G6F67_000755 [Rhizopus microsporus]KAG1269312.1 hypothetical protein G6F68_000389 [Rhizopus microsporus]